MGVSGVVESFNEKNGGLPAVGGEYSMGWGEGERGKGGRRGARRPV